MQRYKWVSTFTRGKPWYRGLWFVLDDSATYCLCQVHFVFLIFCIRPDLILETWNWEEICWMQRFATWKWLAIPHFSLFLFQDEDFRPATEVFGKGGGMDLDYLNQVRVETWTQTNLSTSTSMEVAAAVSPTLRASPSTRRWGLCWSKRCWAWMWLDSDSYLTFLLQFDPLVGGRPSIMVRMGITHFALRSHSQHFPGSSQYGSIQGRDGGHRGGGGGDGVRGSYCYEQVRSLASWTCLVPILPLKNVGIRYQKGKKPENFVSYTCWWVTNLGFQTSFAVPMSGQRRDKIEHPSLPSLSASEHFLHRKYLLMTFCDLFLPVQVQWSRPEEWRLTRPSRRMILRKMMLPGASD